MTNKRQFRRKFSVTLLPLWTGWFLFAIYLLSFSGKFHVMDEVAVFSAGHNLARYGRADINQLIWTNHWTPNPPGIWGIDNNLYTKKAPGISLLAAPLIWLGHALPGLNAVHVGLLTNALVTAVTAGLLLVWLADLGFSRGAAVLAALGYGLGTIAWVYARMFWESSLLALFFLMAVWAAYRATSSPTVARDRGWLLLCGLAVAIGLTLRFEAIVATLFIGLYLLWPGRTREPVPTEAAGPYVSRFVANLLRAAPGLLLYLAPTLLAIAGLSWFNLVRFGSLTETGYTRELLFRAPWIGGWGLLFSPGRGLFIYAPFMLLLFFGLRPAWRRLTRTYFWLVAGLCLFYWLFYGSWFAWGGTWGWGPRFLLPILPLAIVFVAEPIEWAGQTRPITLNIWAARLGIAGLVLLSLAVNLLGITVDFNEHFLRLGRNDNFVFNWAAFPPLGHWRILREGLVDLVWLRPGGNGLAVDWPSLAPALLLLGLAGVMLAAAPRFPKLNLPPPIAISLCLLLTASLTYQMMQATARIGLESEQAQIDRPVLESLDALAQPGDALHVPMPPFGDVLETTTGLMAYLDRPLPTYVWIESEPRSIQPEERERIWRATRTGNGRVWVFERWLTQADPLSVTMDYYGQNAFPVRQQWFPQSGRLTLLDLAGDSPPELSLPLDVPFQGGLSLIGASLWQSSATAGDTLKVRLTWQLPEVDHLAGAGAAAPQLIAFVHLLDPSGERPLAQQDRLLLDLQNVEQSPLLPGQTTPQGYGLQMPDNLAPGSYPLIAGIYTASGGRRLPRADGSPDDFLYLTNVQVP